LTKAYWPLEVSECNNNQILNVNIGFPEIFGGNSSRLTFSLHSLNCRCLKAHQCHCMVGVGKMPKDAEEGANHQREHLQSPHAYMVS
jgi:hypothetical protein